MCVLLTNVMHEVQRCACKSVTGQGIMCMPAERPEQITCCDQESETTQRSNPKSIWIRSRSWGKVGGRLGSIRRVSSMGNAFQRFVKLRFLTKPGRSYSVKPPRRDCLGLRVGVDAKLAPLSNARTRAPSFVFCLSVEGLLGRPECERGGACVSSQPQSSLAIVWKESQLPASSATVGTTSLVKGPSSEA